MIKKREQKVIFLQQERKQLLQVVLIAYNESKYSYKGWNWSMSDYGGYVRLKGPINYKFEIECKQFEIIEQEKFFQECQNNVTEREKRDVFDQKLTDRMEYLKGQLDKNKGELHQMKVEAKKGMKQKKSYRIVDVETGESYQRPSMPKFELKDKNTKKDSVDLSNIYKSKNSDI